MKEQGYICCYCGCKITEDNMIIEHLLPRSRYPNIELDYNNLLASCDGGRKKRTENNKINTQKNNIIPKYRDSAKKNNEIKSTSLMPKCEESFSFDDEGKIYPMSGFQHDCHNREKSHRTLYCTVVIVAPTKSPRVP